MRIDVLTLFPEMFDSVLSTSILKRAADAALHAPSAPPVSYHVHDIRAFTTDKHSKVDKPPYGGGPGMVIQCQPVWDAVQHVELVNLIPPVRILLTPQGERLTQQRVEMLAGTPRLLLIAGHYEGFDERVIDRLKDEGGLLELSIGDYVLSGGELPAMVLIDSVVRLLPGALGDETSASHESFSATGPTGERRGLDYPHYTRPPEWAGRRVPDVLLSGNHAQIEAWRTEQAQTRTAHRQPPPPPPTHH
ncbi:MAG: tRNA (guanosine(37)-N1)-methyltransferase TrmD [Phycisphaera sp.]|nr:tRNA (guanosine(37)-N1)-methyltransferase TrmD [Phycisphaera sp.]